jgi:hypothetical protein
MSSEFRGGASAAASAAAGANMAAGTGASTEQPVRTNNKSDSWNVERGTWNVEHGTWNEKLGRGARARAARGRSHGSVTACMFTQGCQKGMQTLGTGVAAERLKLEVLPVPARKRDRASVPGSREPGCVAEVWGR